MLHLPTVIVVDVKWASRWDAYLQSSGSTSIHWFSIINSLLIVLFLAAMIAAIMLRTLNRDVARYNQVCPCNQMGLCHDSD